MATGFVTKGRHLWPKRLTHKTCASRCFALSRLLGIGRQLRVSRRLVRVFR